MRPPHLAAQRDRRGLFSAFWRDETSWAQLPKSWAKYALLLLVLNEIRGLLVVGAVVKAYIA